MQILFLFAKILLSTYLLITPTSTKWVLIFEDDFNQNEIDTSKWDVVDETSSSDYESKDNVRVKNGNLMMNVREETHNETHSLVGSQIYNKFGAWNGGRFLVRVKLPIGDKIRPSIWLHSVGEPFGPFPMSGKIDIIFVDNIKSDYLLQGGLTTGSHFQFHGFRGTFIDDPRGEWHEFSLEWTRNESVWLIDGKEYARESMLKLFEINPNQLYDQQTQPFDRDFFLTIENGFTIEGSGKDKIDVNTWSQSAMIIDYVRVFKWVEEKNPTINTGYGKNGKNKSYGDKSTETSYSLTLIITASVSAFIVMLIFTLGIIFFMLKRKEKKIKDLTKTNLALKQEQGKGEIYDDIHEHDDDSNDYERISNTYLQMMDINNDIRRVQPHEYDIIDTPYETILEDDENYIEANVQVNQN